MEYLFMLQQALIWIITIFWIYQIMVSVCSLIKLKEKPLLVDKQHKFMAIIPAHNEERVIKNLLDSLKKQDYPKELLDIYVIADNCTDKTAQIAKDAGVFVYERFDEEKKTKGYALQWFLAQKVEENAEYDAMFIFDADNIVDVNFTKNMNKKLCQGEEVVQGYRDIKNPTDSWITAGYAIFYWMMHKFYHLARYNLGLSPLLNGTGFMVKFDLIKEQGGWNTKTLTEDIEYSLINIAKGRKLGWATDAIVFDEQPVEFSQSWKQRTRWTVGHLQCLKLYTKDLARAIKTNKTLMNFDGFLYLMGIPMMLVTFLLLIVNFIIYVASGMTTAALLWSYAKYLGATFLMPILMGLLILALDKRPIRPMIKGLLCYPLFLGSWILINIKSMFKPDTKWEKIEHVRDVKINQIN